MDWVEKLYKLKEERGFAVAHIERKADWPEKTLSNCLSRGSMPLADKGVRLAKALAISADWLFDDSQGWPPPLPVSHGTDLNVVQAMIEATVQRHEVKALPAPKRKPARRR